LGGIVEADETLVLESFKSRCPICRAKPGSAAARPDMGTLYQDNIPVLVARERKGATFDALLPQLDGLP
jgi:hypothetical protein